MSEYPPKTPPMEKLRQSLLIDALEGFPIDGHLEVSAAIDVDPGDQPATNPAHPCKLNELLGENRIRGSRQSRYSIPS